MARTKRKSRSNPHSRRDVFPITNRKVVGSVSHISSGHVDWFQSPNSARMHQRVNRARRIVKAEHKKAEKRKMIRRAALGAVLLMSEDNRRWNPNPAKPARSVGTSKPHRLSISPATAKKQKRLKPSSRLSASVTYPTARVIFRNPQTIAVCVRRKIRKEVILATGSGGGGKRRAPRRNINSSVGC